MKKVLILSNHFATIYKFRRELVEKLVEKGYEVVVSLPKGDDNKEIEALGVRIIETYVDRKTFSGLFKNNQKRKTRHSNRLHNQA